MVLLSFGIPYRSTNEIMIMTGSNRRTDFSDSTIVLDFHSIFYYLNGTPKTLLTLTESQYETLMTRTT